MIKLRPYQIDSIEALRASIKKRHKRIILCASTGSGKSIIMLSMIESAIELKKRVLFICERRILVAQFSRHLDTQGIEHGILMEGHFRYSPDELVQVCSAQTLERMDTWPAFDVIFIDEIHACLRKSVREVMQAFPDKIIIGSTATPWHKELANYFTDIVNVITMEELTNDNFLVPFRVFVSHEIDTTGLKVVGDEWKKDDLEERGRAIVGDVVADYIKISNAVFGGYRKTICFSCGIAHGTDLVNEFNRAGIVAKQLTHKTPDSEKERILNDFARPDTDIVMLISVGILARGFDQTDIEHIISAAPIRKSLCNHIQQIGRGARPHPGTSFCVVQDHGGNWLRFKDEFWEYYYNGEKEIKAYKKTKAKKELTKEQKEAACCPKCGAVWPMKSDICSNCGHTRIRINDVKVKQGEMKEEGNNALDLEKELFRKYKVKDYRDLFNQISSAIKIGTSREETKEGYAKATFYKFTGKAPKYDYNMSPIVHVNKEVLKKIKALKIAWWKGK